MIDGFLLHALIAGVSVAFIAGLLGCFIVWRRMAYFGDALAHSTLLGIALGMVYGISTHLGIILICSLFAIVLLWLQQKQWLATDTLLGILAHASLSIGMVVISLTNNSGIDLHGYLFGDILTVSRQDIYWIAGTAGLVLILLCLNWSSLLLMTLHHDLARAEGVNARHMQWILLFMVTLTVAASIQIVGVLLITSLLIIPAASARQLARSPVSMALFSSAIGMASVIAGLFCSLALDTPSGPTIITLSTLLFVASLFISSLLQRLRFLSR